jgi:hypothetical protein
MSLSVREVVVVDRFHHNGDSFWDGDQTLYELEVVDGDELDSVLVVVPRGDAFISRQTVGRSVENLGASLADLRSIARKPGLNRRPEVILPIEPGQDHLDAPQGSQLRAPGPK